MAHLVVAHCLDGRMIKGESLDVAPGKPECHIRTPSHETVEVRIAHLKALYFVKSLDGNPEHQYATSSKPGDPRLAGSRCVELIFSDGERLVALSNRYPPIGAAFFVLPIDPDGNTIRILVNRDALVSHSLVS